MTIPATYSFTRYLAAKKSVDDRALNRHVWESLVQALPPSSAKSPLQVLEIGAGIGTMAERLLDWGLPTQATYTAIDAEPHNIQAAYHRLPAWAEARGFSAELGPGRMGFLKKESNVLVELEATDLFDFATRHRGQRAWDLLIAHAFLDLMDVPATLPHLFYLLRPNGLFYFTIVFDGATLLEPVIDPALDAHILALYHRTMDQRITAGRPSGDSQAGRHLFGHLQRAGAQVLAAGSSDWVVFAGANGYPADEAYFLHFIVHTIHTALEEHPELDAEQLGDWIAQRHAQIELGQLTYIAHQLDFLGRPPASSNPDVRLSRRP
jgi:SAM-dependent methyltransferase